MKRGRKPIDIDRTQFENLCKLQCTEEEIASWFNCSVDTISRWCKREYKANFAEVFVRYKGIGKISLRRTQFRLAENSPSMAIWLGRNYLGQTDKPITNIDTEDTDTYFEEATL